MYTLRGFYANTVYHELLDRMPEQDLSTGDHKTEPFDLSSGGAFDGLGSEEATSKSYKLTKTMTVWFATQAERITYFETLRGMVGQRGRLFREWQDTNIEWVTARLVKVGAERDLDQIRHLEVDVDFEVYSGYWHGDLIAAWTFDSGEIFDSGLFFDSGGDQVTLDSSPKNFTITLNGNAIVNDPIITVTAGGANITSLTIRNLSSNNEADLRYTGTITSGQALVIDCGAYTVENNGVDDEANHSVGANHAINEWFRLKDGSNSIRISITGGSNDSTIDFDYYVGHK
jgi:hypothetical protein